MSSAKPTLATIWLDGCSGCHMSLLDMDERLLDLLNYADIVYSPLVDRKEFPDKVDITLVEGAVGSEEDLEKIRKVRAHTGTLIALGDCAVTSNVPSMRNPFGVTPIIERAYLENVTIPHAAPFRIVPKLLERVRPVHEAVHVDIFVPGCPPSADVIYSLLHNLLSGQTTQLPTFSQFGA